jgi:hypothetical protein
VAFFGGAVSFDPDESVSIWLLMNAAVAEAKRIRDLAKDIQNQDLKAAISDLYDDIIDVKVRVLELDEENRKLNAQLEESGEVVGPTAPYGYYFSSFDVRARHPLCPECMKDQSLRLAFLSLPATVDGGKVRTCDICTTQFFEEEFLVGPLVG